VPTEQLKQPETFLPVPTTYQIIATGPFNANANFTMSVTAMAGTSVITAYEDPVQITDSQSSVPPLIIPGTSFVNGTASNVNFAVRAARVVGNQFDLTATLSGSQYYDPTNYPTPPNLAPAAQGVLQNLTLVPGPFNKYIMLFPGENLVPGNGKSGTVTPQQSGVNVPLVTTYRVDQFFNPIYTPPTPAANLRFTSDRGIDSPPFPINVTMNGSVLTIDNNSVNALRFNGAGTAHVRVEDLAMGGTGEEDISTVVLQAPCKIGTQTSGSLLPSN
jgi:hypothetical protein